MPQSHPLEPRRLLAGEFAFIEESGQRLRVMGTAGDDVISIALGTGGMIDVTRNGQTISLPNSQPTLFAQGGDGNDLITTSFGGRNIRLAGDNGDDTLIGGRGKDVLTGGKGNDSMVGGSGIDSFNDVGFGEVGNDTMRGQGGDDVFFLDTGDDVVDGGSESTADEIRDFGLDNDLIITLDAIANDGTAGSNTGNYFDIESILAGTGNDSIIGSSKNETIDGGGGNDTLFGQGGDDNLRVSGSSQVDGGSGDDFIEAVGNSGNYTLFGRGGDDTITGGINSDTIDGGTGNDSLDGSAGNDTLYGRSGNDTLIGGPARDILLGSTGDDVIRAADNRADNINGGADNDTADIDESLDVVAAVEATT